MKRGKDRLSRQHKVIAREPRRLRLVDLALSLACTVLLSGCVGQRWDVEKNLFNDKLVAARNQDVIELYRVGCPDALEIEVSGNRESRKPVTVGPDGRIDLGPYGQPRVEGRTPGEVARIIADHVGSEPNQVRVRIAEFRAERVYLFGQVIGWQRAVPYQGQETVLDLLQRVGGITPGAAPGDVLVVRPNLGKRPEVFHVNLSAIVLDKDTRTNIRIQPQDHVYVGETPRARLQKGAPSWLRGFFQSLWNTSPGEKRAVENSSSEWISGPVMVANRQE